ncbi:putative glutathione-dependent formaldehyde-activating enzyme [Aspergillus uvarum CBS 121591]|uniref:Putative glutathione-dependent formaldehyde-activating enzyme n=1 Tax=Aspergillus uvarum CBS 121591 TaxID=1448315 RepID=A0A319CAH4_9EURO|nr:putative glutathione-dependent formaldehyde-activating enzyme [Aspergillus uvarum CBS 121591]PYH81250.1 putative glutathione-dependent formaldehyde-activating enzyme [Aspergillus uvarum CBS 121591]
MAISLHPLLDKPIQKGSPNFTGGTLKCHCATQPVTVKISSNVAHNHACGCSKCWKPKGALFSVVGVVPREKVQVLSHADKLAIVDEAAVIQRHACTACGVHLFGRIEKDHPFKGLDFVHVELSEQQGWQEVQFAGFVSSIIEQGFPPNKMEEVRGRLRGLGLETFDVLAPGLMDAIAAWTAEREGKLKASL